MKKIITILALAFAFNLAQAAGQVIATVDFKKIYSEYWRTDQAQKKLKVKEDDAKKKKETVELRVVAGPAPTAALSYEQAFERVGGTTTIEVDVRVIAATHRNLAIMVRAGQFREDLFYRLNVFPLTLPPLRERQEDIPILSRYFAQRKSARLGRTPCSVTTAAMERLSGYSWPGNIRELENIIERAVILCDGDTIDFPHVQVEDVTPRHDAPDTGIRPLQEIEKEHILSSLQVTGGKVSGQGGAAELLGLKPSTLESRMKKLGIGRNDV